VLPSFCERIVEQAQKLLPHSHLFVELKFWNNPFDNPPSFYFSFPPKKKGKEKKTSESFLPTLLHTRVLRKEKRERSQKSESFISGGEGINLATEKEILTRSNLESTTVLAN
jgi:hypothetical protein